MINGLLTLRGAWNKVARRIRCSSSSSSAITFYGMATFEGPMLSIKSVNALAHYTDWIIAPRPRRRARLERLHGVRHDLLAAPAPLPDEALLARSSPTRTSGSATFGILLYVVAM